MSALICIYHGNCADGFTAAWVVWRALGPDFEFVPGVYGKAPPDVTDRDVILVDFSYKRSVLEAMAAQARSILVLDHHKTAAEDLVGFPSPDRGGWEHESWAAHLDAVDVSAYGRVPAVLFDMHRSGAQIAWDFFFPNDCPPRLIDYVADRDLWRFSLSGSREVAAALFSRPYDFTVWAALEVALDTEEGLQECMFEGAAIERKHHKDIAELVSVTRRDMMIAGYRVPVANLPYTMASDAAHLMAEDAPFAACYFDRPDARVFSLRSREGGMDVAAIAAFYGGGGHRHAAGFQRPLGWCGDDCWPETSGRADSLARALGECLRFRNWQLAERGTLLPPPDLRTVWRDAEAALQEWEGAR